MTGTYLFDWLLFLGLLTAPFLATGCAVRARRGRSALRGRRGPR